MKHLKLFENTQSYDNFKNGDDFILPNVSYILEGSKLFYNPYLNLNSTIYATYNATPGNMLVLRNTSNVKSLVIDGVNVEFEPINIESHTINIIGENIQLSDYDSVFPEEYYFNVENGTMCKINCDLSTITGVAFYFEDLGQTARIDLSNLVEMGIASIENETCMSIDFSLFQQEGSLPRCALCAINDFGAVNSTNEIITMQGGLPSPYYFETEGEHNVEIELLDDSVISNLMFSNSNTAIEYSDSECGILSISIPDTVSAIDTGAFYRCDKLSSIEIGTGIKEISHLAFYYCPRLQQITCKAVSEPSFTETS